MATKSIRIPDEQAVALEAIAMANETTVSEIVRDAISDRLAVLRKDKNLQARASTPPSSAAAAPSSSSPSS